MAKDSGAMSGSSEGGVSGTHGQTTLPTLAVGSSTGDEFNRLRLALASNACFRVDDVRFAFDSSFLIANPDDETKDIRAELKLLVNLLQENPHSPLSVFGHADPVGADDYNKQLSGRRATVIYALLISGTDPNTAAAMWQDVAAKEHWGAPQRQSMQTFTGLPEGTADLTLIQAYMAKLRPKELLLSKEDFLGKGADPKGKGDRQGCGEFNPALIFSQQRSDAFDKAHDEQGRNDANARNRRVMVVLFKPNTKLDVNQWPCPRVDEGTAGCRARFFVENGKVRGGEWRRSHREPDTDRTYEKTQDTFACRFYDRIMNTSPCESPVKSLKIRLFDPQGRPLPFAPCLVTMDGKTTAMHASGAPPSPAGETPTEAPGAVSTTDKEAGYINLSVQKLPATVIVRWSRVKKTELGLLPDVNDLEDFEYTKEVLVAMPDDDADDTTRKRLKNLGYNTQPQTTELIPGYGDPLTVFQNDYKPVFAEIIVDGTLNDPTKQAARTAHNAAQPVMRDGSNVKLVR